MSYLSLLPSYREFCIVITLSINEVSTTVPTQLFTSKYSISYINPFVNSVNCSLDKSVIA